MAALTDTEHVEDLREAYAARRNPSPRGPDRRRPDVDPDSAAGLYLWVADLANSGLTRGRSWTDWPELFGILAPAPYGTAAHGRVRVATASDERVAAAGQPGIREAWSAC